MVERGILFWYRFGLERYRSMIVGSGGSRNGQRKNHYDGWTGLSEKWCERVDDLCPLPYSVFRGCFGRAFFRARLQKKNTLKAKNSGVAFDTS